MRFLRTLAAVTALATLAGCGTVAEVREQTVDVGLKVYRTEACATGAAGAVVRDQQRAEVYAATGVFAEADCAFRPGDTVDDYLARRPAAEAGAAASAGAGE